MCFHRSISNAFLLLFLLPVPGFSSFEEQQLEKSAYFAYVDRDYVFTVEVVRPGIPILNFVSMVDRDKKLRAGDIRLRLQNRQVLVELFHIEGDRMQRPLLVPSLEMHPRSSFGFRLEGNFGDAKELHGAEIKLGEETFTLVPLSKFDFETLVLKVNRLNLESPDFGEDFRVLKLEPMGLRSSRR